MDFSNIQYFKVEPKVESEIQIYDVNQVAEGGNISFNYQPLNHEAPKPAQKAASSSKSSPNRSKSMSGFILYQAKTRNEFKTKYPEANFGQLSKLLSESWKTMSDGEKAMWREEAIKANQIQREQNIHANKRFGKVARKPLSSGFLVFAKAHRKKMHDSNPGISFGEASKILGQMWRNMDAAEKQKWTEEANAAHEAHENTYGFEQQPASHSKGGVKSKRAGYVTGFILFQAENRKLFHDSNPNCSFGEMSHKLSDAWKNLKEEEKATWKVKALEANKKAKERNQQEARTTVVPRANTTKAVQRAAVADNSSVVVSGGTVFDCQWNACNLQFRNKQDFLQHTVEYCVYQGPRPTYKVNRVDRYSCLWRGCKNSMGFGKFEEVVAHVRLNHVIQNHGRGNNTQSPVASIQVGAINSNTPVQLTFSGNQVPSTSQVQLNQQQVSFNNQQWTYTAQPTYTIVQPSTSSSLENTSYTVLQPSYQPAQYTVVQPTAQFVVQPLVQSNHSAIQAQPAHQGGGNVQQSHAGSKNVNEKAGKRKGNHHGNVTGFILFQAAKRKELSEKAFEGDSGPKNFGKISKMMGEMWEKLTDQDRAMWKAKAQEANRVKKQQRAQDESNAAAAAGGTVVISTTKAPAVPKQEVFDCMYDQCNYRFSQMADLLEHIRNVCVRDDPKIIYVHNQTKWYKCIWRGCPDPTVYQEFSRLVDHIQQVHVLRSGQVHDKSKFFPHFNHKK